jgi:hypothetical protein
MLIDSRPGHKRLNYTLNSVQREIYDFCEEIRSRASLEAFAAGKSGTETSLDSFLQQLVSYRLMLQEGNQYLSLAVDIRRYGRPVGAAEATTF